MDIKNIKKQIYEKSNNQIEKYKDAIIDTFSEFYGEEYREIIKERYENISFLYYINDFTIFYIINNLKNNKMLDKAYMIPYLTYLIKNNLYKVEITPENFYELGKNKIIGVSNNDLLSNDLLKYTIATTLRKDNEYPYEVNILLNNNIKRIIALPVFSVNDHDLFHELNHAICSSLIYKDNDVSIKCGINAKNKTMEVINDLTSNEIYNIFSEKYKTNILSDYIMKDAFLNENIDYSLIQNFYKENKNIIKKMLIEDLKYSVDDKLNIIK